MPTTGTRHSYRYIDIDWRDDTSGVPVWRLVVDGTHVATAVVGDWTAPPFALTEGLPFVPQYHSAESAGAGQPDSWVASPPGRRELFLPMVAAAGIAGVGSIVWPVLVVPALLLIAIAVLRETK